MGLDELTTGDWRCDVCGRSRPYEKISVAKHLHVDGNGVEVESLVNYCNDSDTCGRIARVRSHIDLAYHALQETADELTTAVWRLHAKLTTRSILILVAFVIGFVIRGAI